MGRSTGRLAAWMASFLVIFMIAPSAYARGADAAAPLFTEKAPAVLIDSVARIDINKDDQNDNRFGSGFFVDFTGCLITNSHVAVDLEKKQAEPSIDISISKNNRRKPEKIGAAKVLYFDPAVDIAYLCIQNSPDFFPELPLASGAEVDAVNFGDSVRIVGYPQIATDSVTYSNGKIIGFWEEPDVKQIGGADKVDPKRVTLLKIDAVSGPGGSGSPIINNQDKVVGIMFAGQLSGAIPDLAIWTKSFSDIIEKAKAAVAPAPGCIFDPQFNLYSKDGALFYDGNCAASRDKNLESVVAANYQDRCSGQIGQDKLFKAAGHIKLGSSIDKWYEYLGKICRGSAAPTVLNGDSSGKTVPAQAKPSARQAFGVHKARKSKRMIQVKKKLARNNY